jgi:hypothetical protein
MERIVAITSAMPPEHAGIFILPVILIVFYMFVFALIVIVLIRLSRFLINVPKEQKLLRFEMGKLAEEVHQIRKELGDKSGNS